MIRLILKYYIRWRVRQYLAFFGSRKGKQSNANINKARFMKARLMYWESQFEPWGKYFLAGRNGFSYDDKTQIRWEKEMIWMGFTSEIRIKEWDITKNEEYPWTINYYPAKTTNFNNGVGFSLDYREILNKETGTFENYEIKKEWKK